MRQRVIMGAAVGTMQPPVCHFWKLPLELRFAIYDLAYGRGKTITPKESATLVQLGRGRVQEQYSDVNDRKVCYDFVLSSRHALTRPETQDCRRKTFGQ